MKRRASTSEQARAYRQAGHDDALRFAQEIGVESDYKNRQAAKKDVVDQSGDTHSVKSGQKKWQIFLYGRNRFLNDDGFQALNGIGGLLVHCIDAFPPSYTEYRQNPEAAKERLRTPMRELKDRFQRKALLRAFLSKSIFNGGEVDYLTILHDNFFHVFLNRDVVRVMGSAFEVVNSQGDQKVLFRHKGLNVGELEMRTDSEQHYPEVRFNMIKPKAVALLLEAITRSEQYSPVVRVYDNALKRFRKFK